MRAPSATDLLLAWEHGLDQSPTQRALTLLAAAYPEAPPDRLAALSIGKRDTHLLSLRELLFGRSIAAVSQCHTCAEKLQLTFDVNDICDTKSLLSIGSEYHDIESGQQEHRLNVAD